MQIQIYTLFALVALIAVVLLYVILACKDKFDALDSAVERRVKQAGNAAVKIKELDGVIKSLKLCSAPYSGLDYCDSCVMTDDGSGDCVSDLCLMAADLLNEYKEMLEHGRT